jgi:hypothetical protein
MIIDSSLSIKQYDGKADLPLVTGLPNGISIGSLEATQYKTFINNIKIIYGSQKNDGSIPVFFKNADNTINTSSTLNSLKSANSYYFISHKEDPSTRNKIVFPYKVPALSGDISFVNDTALVNFDHASVVYVLSDGCATPLPITASVSNTVNGQAYTFIASAISNNGNPSIVPVSGSITCNNGVVGKIPLSILFNDSNNVVVSLQLIKDNKTVCSDSMVLICGDETYVSALSSQSILNSQSLDSQLTTQAVSVQCPPEYASIGKPDIQFNTSAVTSLSAIDLLNPIPITATIRNAKKDNYEYTYAYSVNSSENVAFIVPSSGSTFTNSYKCDGTSSYSSGDITAVLYMNGAKDAVVEVKLLDKGKVVDNDSINLVYKRNDAYSDQSGYAVCPVIDTGNTIVNLTGINNYTYNLSNGISKLTIGKQYSYEFSGVSANWPSKIYPVSGSFYADTESFVLNNFLHFDSDSSCNDCFPFSTGVAFSSDIKDKKFSVVKLNVKPINFSGCNNGTEKYINIYCDNCLLQPTPTPTTTTTITPTPSITSTVTATVTPTITSTITPTITPTVTLTATPTVTPTVTPTITTTATPTITPTITTTATPTVTPTVTPTSSSLLSFTTALAITSQTTTAGESGGSINFKGNVGDMLEFKSLTTPNSPTVMRLLINSVQVSQVTFPYDTYSGKLFRFTRGSTGVKYVGAFASGDVNIG